MTEQGPDLAAVAQIAAERVGAVRYGRPVNWAAVAREIAFLQAYQQYMDAFFRNNPSGPKDLPWWRPR